MAKKKTVDDVLVSFKKDLKGKNILFGSERTIKALRIGKVERIYFSSNCPEVAEEDIRTYAGLSEVPLFQLQYPNDEIGALCKKPFAISVVAVTK